MKPILSLGISMSLLALFSVANTQQANTNDTASPDAATLKFQINRIEVSLNAGANIAAFAKQYKISYLYSLKSNGNAHIFQTNTVADANRLLTALQLDSRVEGLSPVSQVKMTKLVFTPNDPYYVPVSSFTGQWHLNNVGSGGSNVNANGAWISDITGTGVKIGICDDSLQTTHPDLAPNYNATDSWDFGQHDADPNPVNTSDEHGISVSGVAAARGGNGIGVTGIAPFASIAGLRLDFGTSSDQDFADAITYHSSGANTNLKIKNHSYGWGAPFIDDTLSYNSVLTSGAAGTIHCFAAGNARGSSAQDSGKQHELSTPYTITVAALGSNGVFSSYSSFGANVFVCAPSSGISNFGITTTDRLGTLGYNWSVNNDYTNTFGGTSSASPLVAGCMALLKQVAPAADTRFAKHILARTSTIVDAGNNDTTSDGGWKTNAAGLKFNQNYGFGLVNCGTMTAKAVNYSGISARIDWTSNLQTVGSAIPDNNTTGISRTVSCTTSGKVEDIELKMNCSHPHRGNLEFFVTSPSGTTQRLCYRSSSDANASIPWTFIGNAFWGEPSAGNWTVKVVDTASSNTGTWTDFTLIVHTGNLIGKQKIAGSLALQDYNPNPTASLVTMQLFDSTGTTLVQSVPVVYGSGSNYSSSFNVADGNYVVKVKGTKWLRAKSGLVTLTGGGTSTLNWSLINGDCDNDNVVSIFDYILMSNAFDTALGDGLYDARADLDGDNVVSIFDYIILSNNFDLVGVD